MSDRVDVMKEISNASLGGFHYKIMLLIGLITSFDSFGIFIPVYTIHYVVKPWHIPHDSIGLLVSSGLFGVVFGSMFSGFFADRIGRKTTLIAALYLSGVFSLLTALIWNTFEGFILLRFITGLGLGVLLPGGVAYINELSPTKGCNVICVTGAMGFMFGAVLASVAGAFLTPWAGWHILYYIAGLSILLAVVCHGLLDESPKFLVTSRPEKKALIRKILSKIQPEKASLYEASDFAAISHTKHKSRLVELFAPAYRRNTIVVWVASFFGAFQIYGVGAWLPQLMIHRGFGIAASFLFGAVMQASGIAGSYMLGGIADFLTGRRWAIAGGALLTAAASLIFISAHSLSLDIVLAVLMGFGTIGAQNIVNNYTAQSYSTAIRGTGQGMQLGVGRVGGVCGPYIMGLLGAIELHQTPFFIIVAVAAVICSSSMLFGRREFEEAAGQEGLECTLAS